MEFVALGSNYKARTLSVLQGDPKTWCVEFGAICTRKMFNMNKL